MHRHRSIPIHYGAVDLYASRPIIVSQDEQTYKPVRLAPNYVHLGMVVNMHSTLPQLSYFVNKHAIPFLSQFEMLK